MRAGLGVLLLLAAGASHARRAGLGTGVNGRRKPAPYWQLAEVPSRAVIDALPVLSIDSYGAVPSDQSAEAARANAKAIEAAVAASANGAGVAVVPADKVYDVLPVSITSLSDAALRIEGTLSAHQNISEWPLARPGSYKPLLSIDTCTGFALTGTPSSLIEGHGLPWWWVRVLNVKGLAGDAPTLVDGRGNSGMLVSGVRTSNSPRYNFFLGQSRGLEVEGVHIWTDWGGAVEGLEAAGLLARSHDESVEALAAALAAEAGVDAATAKAAVEGWVASASAAGVSGAEHAASMTVRAAASALGQGIPFPGVPMYPLNTDGIDVAGQGIWIHDCNVTNWDDSYCVKPQPVNGAGTIGCSQNITIEDSIVLFGVGASMGSVPPNAGVNCIRDVHVRNISFTAPTKTLYVKTNGGDSGTGIIEGVHYSNISAAEGFWYPIYVGPQQQEEPDGAGDGWWPATQPRVSVNNITFDGIHMDNVLWPQPGVLRCNSTNPCHGIDFFNVDLRSSLWNASTFSWVCEETYGKFQTLAPMPACNNSLPGARDRRTA